MRPRLDGVDTSDETSNCTRRRAIKIGIDRMLSSSILIEESRSTGRIFLSRSLTAQHPFFRPSLCLSFSLFLSLSLLPHDCDHSDGWTSTAQRRSDSLGPSATDVYTVPNGAPGTTLTRRLLSSLTPQQQQQQQQSSVLKCAGTRAMPKRDTSTHRLQHDGDYTTSPRIETINLMRHRPIARNG